MIDTLDLHKVQSQQKYLLIENNNGARDIVNNVYKKVYEYNFVENESYDKIINNIENYNDIEQLSLYLPIIDPNYVSFISLFNKPICIFDEFKKLKEHESKTKTEWILQIHRRCGQRTRWSPGSAPAAKRNTPAVYVHARLDTRC